MGLSKRYLSILFRSRIFPFLLIVIVGLNCWLAERTLEQNITNNNTNNNNNNNNNHRLLTEENFECLGWKQTGGCTPYGRREPKNDLNCTTKVPEDMSGYCLFRDKSAPPFLNEQKAMMKFCSQERDAGKEIVCSDARTFVNFAFHARTHEQKPPMSHYTNNKKKKKKNARGIVMAAKEDTMVNAYCGIKMLRSHGCELPLELWSMPGEITPENPLLSELLSEDNVVHRVTDDPRYKEYMIKPYIVYYSGFNEILLMDSDNVPAKDPTYLFEIHEYKSTGALFFPDYWSPYNNIFHLDRKNLIWELLDIPFVNSLEQEAGQLLIDKSRSQRPLNILMYLARDYDSNIIGKYGLLHGDKDMYRMAWMMAGQDYHMISIPPSPLGRKSGEDDYSSLFCGNTMAQHDPDGSIVFLHRNILKLSWKEGGTKLWTHLQDFTGSDIKDLDIHYEETFAFSDSGKKRIDFEENFSNDDDVRMNLDERQQSAHCFGKFFYDGSRFVVLDVQDSYGTLENELLAHRENALVLIGRKE